MIYEKIAVTNNSVTLTTEKNIDDYVKRFKALRLFKKILVFLVPGALI
jgi:hypothetical protein